MQPDSKTGKQFAVIKQLMEEQGGSARKREMMEPLMKTGLLIDFANASEESWPPDHRLPGNMEFG
jgi:hypothetical protein